MTKPTKEWLDDLERTEQAIRRDGYLPAEVALPLCAALRDALQVKANADALILVGARKGSLSGTINRRGLPGDGI